MANSFFVFENGEIIRKIEVCHGADFEPVNEGYIFILNLMILCIKRMKILILNILIYNPKSFLLILNSSTSYFHLKSLILHLKKQNGFSI